MTNHGFSYREIRIDKWGTLRDVLRRFQDGWIFRGQSDANWTLCSTLERANTSDLPLSLVECALLEDFKRRAHHYLTASELPQSQLDWLALMQHHGAPTRLLDWTYSPYVALFFAIERADQDCALWIIGLERLRTGGSNILQNAGFLDAPTYATKDAYHHDTILSTNLTGVFATEPLRVSERLSIQQGLFLVGGNSSVSFAENLLATPFPSIPEDASSLPEAQAPPPSCPFGVYKLIVSASCRPDILADLKRMNIGQETLFPGMDGFARSMWTSSFLVKGERKDPVWSSYLNEPYLDFFFPNLTIVDVEGAHTQPDSNSGQTEGETDQKNTPTFD